MAEEKKEETKAVKKDGLDLPEFKFRKPTDHDYAVLNYMLVTEKTQKMAADQNVITLKVSKDANKDEIKDAVQAVFGVKVVKVNTVNVHPKKRSFRRGYQGAFKKAMVFVDKAYDLGKIQQAVASEDRKN